MKRKLVSPKWPVNENGQVWLHIGCGKKIYKGFINIDALPYPHIHLVKNNITEVNEFQDNSVDVVYMCHVLEHFKREEAFFVLREMHRLLKPSGKLFLSVPDFDKLLFVYGESGNHVNVIHDQLMGGQDNPYNVHYTIFSQESLSCLLRKAGFEVVEEWMPETLKEFQVNDRSSRKLNLNGQRFSISLNLVATK